jgi:HK97 family phage portal protein
VSLFTRSHQKRDLFGITGAGDLIPSRALAGRTGSVNVTEDSALRHSAVWACLRTRADLISTFPLDVFRKVDGLQVEVPKPPVLVTPGGDRWDYVDWMYASQVDLDRAGNTIGLITERNSLNLPSRIDLQPIQICSVVERPATGLMYRIGGKEFAPSQVWHERQYVVAGLPVGLSPVAYAAWCIGEYLSIQDFALDWFGGGGRPAAQLRNREKTLKPNEADAIKSRFKATQSAGDVFVTGNDWEFNPIQAEQTGMEWIEARKYGVTDISRFFGCPADLIDAAVSGSSVTYANITQRNLQYLIMQLGPAVIRREKNLSKLLPVPRFVKLNTDALLRMDAATRAATVQTRIESRTLAPSEARAYENQPPLTDAQLAEFDRLFGKPNMQPVAAKNPTGATA